MLGFVLAASIVVLITPVVGWVARRTGVVDRPDDPRRLHLSASPLLGGVALFVATIVPVVALSPQREDATWAIVAGGTIIAVVGLLDDFWEMNPLVKFAGQLAAIAAVLAFGLRIDSVTVPLTSITYDLSQWVSVPLTVLWIVTIVNIVNFIDGLDGLAAGVCGISALTFAIIALSLNRGTMGVTAAVLAGAAFGFLRFNFYPASIFMGDAGSMFLGLALAVISIQGVLKGAATVALLFPLLVLGVPFFDLFLVVFRRWRKGIPFYAATSDHVHESLVLRVGFSQRKTVLLLYGWCLLLSGVALAMRFRDPVFIGILGIAAVVASASMLRLLLRYRRDKRSDRELSDTLTDTMSGMSRRTMHIYGRQ